MSGFNARRYLKEADRTPAVISYPVASLPDCIHKAVQCVSERHQIQPAMCASVANAVLSIALQRFLMVKLPGGRLRPTCLFFLILGDSGTGKSTGYGAFTPSLLEREATFVALDAKAEMEFKSLHRIWTKQQTKLINSIHELQLKGEYYGHLRDELNKLVQSEPIVPRSMSMLIADTTGAAFIERLDGDRQSVAVTTDEAIITFNYLYQYFGYLNLAWDGSTIPVTRKGSGRINAVNPRAGVLLMSQPTIFNDFCGLHGDVAGSVGAWARYLIAFPPVVQDKVYPNDPDSISMDGLDKFNAMIADLIDEFMKRMADGITEPVIVEMDSGASARYTTFANEMNERMKAGNNLDDVKDFASKAAEHAARLAANYAYMAKETKITAETMENAINIIRYHLEEYCNQFSLVRAVPKVPRHAEQMETHFLRKYVKKNWTSVELDHLHHSNTSDELKVDANLLPALIYLEQQGKVQLHRRGNAVHINFRNLISFPNA
ncbi:DUF3987 domain-containing protein [Dyella monticola]|uniref:DUF3987 domain-containing protein n=1 Tax=Dyella monticola TaxID=1927958 RepID=A0A370X1G9_9GAMM|nr:DUF3987 domain-containing protein [Dyella monticola]RDS82249.1 DUF3987 domain-containing protein [Dyella monticola]